MATALVLLTISSASGLLWGASLMTWVGFCFFISQGAVFWGDIIIANDLRKSEFSL